MSAWHRLRPELRCAAAAALIGFALYANTLRHGYVLDDALVVTGHPDVLAGVRGIPNILGADTLHFAKVNLGYYRPLSLVTFALENQFLPGDPHAGHWGNVILYAATGFFLCLLLLRVFRRLHPSFSFLIAALFMAHPIHTEVVANIKSRDELLAFLNTVVALWLFVGSFAVDYKRSAVDWKRYLPSLLFFYLALLSKETAACGLLLAPLALYFATELGPADCLFWAFPWAVVAGLVEFQKFMVLGTLASAVPKDLANYPYAVAGAKLPSAFMILARYVKLMLFPHPLSYDYSFDQIPAARSLSPAVLAGLLIAAALAFFGCKGLAAKSPRALGVAIFSITLAPALAFVLLRGGILAERLLYAPTLGFSIVLVFVLAKAAGVPVSEPQAPWRSVLGSAKLLAPLAAIGGLYTVKTVTRNAAWRDNMALFSTDAATSSASVQARRHYGSELINASVAEKDPARKEELFAKGVAELQASLRIDPGFADSFFKLGVAYQLVHGDDKSAIYYYTRAIEAAPQAPGTANVYSNLGTVYEKLGKQELASFYFNKAVEVNSFMAQGVSNHRRHMKRTGLDVRRLPGSGA